MSAGADIAISRLESQNSDLLMELETRKLVERGKGILQRELGLSEHEAFLALQRQSQQKKATDERDCSSHHLGG